MSIHNRYSAVALVSEDFTAYDAGITAAKDVMDALPEVDPLIMRRVVKIGPKTETFTRDAVELARQNPGLLPVDLDLAEIEADLAMRHQLKVRYLELVEMAKRMRGAIMLLGSDAYSGSLAAYKAMKVNNRSASLTEQLRELGRVFSRIQEEQDGEEELAPTDPEAGV